MLQLVTVLCWAAYIYIYAAQLYIYSYSDPRFCCYTCSGSYRLTVFTSLLIQLFQSMNVRCWAAVMGSLAAMVASARTPEHAREALAAAEKSAESRAALPLHDGTDRAHYESHCSAQNSIGHALVVVRRGR